MKTSGAVSRRRFLTLATIGVASAGVFAACSQTPAPAPTAASSTSNEASKGSAPTAAPAPKAGGASAGQKVKVSISHIGGGSLEGSEASDRMKQVRSAFPNIEIENRWMSYAAYVDKISLITATGDLADLQFANAFNDVPLMMDNDLLHETNALLDTEGKHILAATPKDAWDSTIYDGKQFAAAHNIYDLNIWGVFYRKDWLDKLGEKVPETLDQYAELLKKFTFNDPDGNGTPDTYGRAFMPSIKFDDDIFHAFDVAVGHHANGFWRERDGKLALDWVHPGMKEAWAWLRARWADKSIDPDSLTAQISYRGQQWDAGRIGSEYAAWTGMDNQVITLRKVDPKADIVPGPALKGPKGSQGFTGEGFPWTYVIPKKSQNPEAAMRIIDWFFIPQNAARFTCEGELGITNKGVNDKGWCMEYTPTEKRAMGEEWTNRVNQAKDISAYGGLWTPFGAEAVRPWLLNTMPDDMKAHFEGILKGRYSEVARQGMNYAAKYVKISQKKRPTPSEKKYWPGLQSRFLELMTQVVAGTIALDQGWKDWQSFFEQNGGSTLTKEVNDLK